MCYLINMLVQKTQHTPDFPGQNGGNLHNAGTVAYVQRWVQTINSTGYDMETDTVYQTSYANPAKWYDLDPTEKVPGMGNVIRQYSVFIE